MRREEEQRVITTTGEAQSIAKRAEPAGERIILPGGVISREREGVCADRRDLLKNLRLQSDREFSRLLDVQVKSRVTWW